MISITTSIKMTLNIITNIKNISPRNKYYQYENIGLNSEQHIDRLSEFSFNKRSKPSTHHARLNEQEFAPYSNTSST